MLAGGLPGGPTIFTMAHELKHRLVDSKIGIFLRETSDQTRRIEIAAEVFAAELIYPEKEFRV
jgi:Zn-dependent peptidase ImmA (M78 family)